MILMLDLTPEMGIKLQEEAARCGQEPSNYALAALQRILGLGDSEAAIMDEWRGASNFSLQELWDNEEDAVYDKL